MNEILTGIKKLSEKLSGTPSAQEYRDLQLLKKELDKYEKELICENLALDYDAGFLRAAMTISHANIPLAHNYEKRYVAGVWNFPEASAEFVELFVLMHHKKHTIIGLCSYRQCGIGIDAADELELFADRYGKVEFSDWQQPARMTERLSEIVSEAGVPLKKTAPGLYVMEIPAINTIAELQESVIPKIKAVYDVLERSGLKKINL